MRPFRVLFPFAVATLAASISACGGKDICLGCDPNAQPTAGPDNTVQVDGNIFQLSTPDPRDTITVIICVDLPADTRLEDCPDIFTTESDSQGSFSRTRISTGDLTLGFWVDRNEDGLIADPDVFARLDDPGADLAELDGGDEATITDIDIDFAAGTASAALIDVESDGSSGNTEDPSAAPTPSAG